MVRSMMNNAGHICDKCTYNGLCLPDVVIHFEYTNSESAQVMKMLFNQMYR